MIRVIDAKHCLWRSIEWDCDLQNLDVLFFRKVVKTLALWALLIFGIIIFLGTVDDITILITHIADEVDIIVYFAIM